MSNQLNPRDFNLPASHKVLYPSQQDLYKHLYNTYHNDGPKFIFGQKPTGAGKSAVAAMAAEIDQVTYIAGTLALVDQIEREYGFVAIKGKQEYPCADKAKVKDWLATYDIMPTAADCHLSKMTSCKFASDCKYLVKKHKAVSSRKMACTYKYAMLSSLVQARRGITVLDECHSSVDEILSFAEFKMNELVRKKWRLPEFPYRQPYGGRGDVLSMDARDKVNEWLTKCISSLTLLSGANSKEGSQAKRLLSRLTRVKEELPSSNWFLQCGRGILKSYTKSGYKNLDGIYLRALDARAIAPRLWENKQLTLLMSATIGRDAKAIAGQLNIDEHQFLDYPHPVPAECRPVYDLGLPRMTKANLTKQPGLYFLQARSIYEKIVTFDPSWRGLILTSSYYKIKKLRELLSLWLGDRVFVPPAKAGPAQRAAAFISDPRPGLIAIDTMQGWGHGLDLRGDLGRFVVIAGVPFENPSDPFVQARRKVIGADAYMWQQAYTSIPQAAGRVSRGERDENGDWLLNVAVLADGSATSPRARKHYPEWFEAN